MGNEKPALSVVIVSFNTAKLTSSCVKSIFEQGGVDINQLELIVVDNASSDDSVKSISVLMKTYSQISLIKNTKNLGFAKANNQGIKKATGEFVLLLNSDTIVQKDALSNLVQTHQAKKQANEQWLLAASLQNTDGSYQSQGGTEVSLLAVAVQWWFLDDIPLVGSTLPTMQNRHPLQSNKPIVQMGWVGGAALSFPRKLFKEIGGLDESFFMYAEDVEYCLRASRAGWRVGIATQSKITHHGSASGSSEKALVGEVKGLLMLWPKYFGSLSTLLLKIILSIGASLRIAVFGLLGRGAQAKIYAQILKLVWV